MLNGTLINNYIELINMPPSVPDPQIKQVTPQTDDSDEGVKGQQYQSYKPIPQTQRKQIGNYYGEIKWPEFEKWTVVRFSTPMDGSCFFHAITNAFFAPYHTETFRGKHTSRNQIVTMLRQDLSERLTKPISDTPNAPIHYDILNGGNTREFAKHVPEFSLENMQKELASHNPIGFGYLEFIGNALDKDIYILEARRRDIYVTHELALSIKGNRKSIVLYYMDGHYELVGIQNSDESFVTYFSHNHTFIQFLYSRVQERLSKLKT